MARARNIKPAFFQNEDLAELQPIARLAFIAMWTVADYKGCMEYRPKRLKVQLLPSPFSNTSTEADMILLALICSMISYIVGVLIGRYIGSRHRKFVESARSLTRMEMRKLFPPSEAKNFLRKVKAWQNESKLSIGGDDIIHR